MWEYIKAAAHSKNPAQTEMKRQQLVRSVEQSILQVNQARAYTAEALRLNPASAGLLGGDLRRRQALMDRFLDRTWKTYVALRIAEQQAAKDTAIAALLEQAPEAARAAVDPLLKQDQGDQ